MNTTPRPRRIRRSAGALALAVSLVFVSTACDPYSAWQEKARTLVNNTRSRHDERRLSMNLAAANKAQRWAQQLARCRCLRHSNLAAGMPAGWRAIAENVGYGVPGGNIRSVHRAFMRSSGHRGNILDSRWNVVGTGVATRNRVKYVVHVFARY